MNCVVVGEMREMFDKEGDRGIGDMREVFDMEGDCCVGDIRGERRPNPAESLLIIENVDAHPLTAFFHSKGSNCKILLISVAFGRCWGSLCQQRFRSGLRSFNCGTAFDGISGRSCLVTTLWITSISCKSGNGGPPV